jgi:arabinose-5-phosphate isomerase
MTNTDVSTLAFTQAALRLEADAIYKLAEDMPADFMPLVQRILAIKGRVIVSGIGKSGHIARKIASTLMSTGTPCMYLHPAEASHGDLGMIQRDDICLLVSNSGETRELSDILAYTRRFNIPMAAISAKPDSTLIKAADYKLVLPPFQEACPMGLAPTTSTTVTLALGDAIAIALMVERGFQAEDFQVFHPGGKLGAQLTRVGEIMHGVDTIPIVSADLAMPEVLIAMTSGGFGVACVTQNDVLLGIVTDGDLRRNMDDLMARTAGQIATLDPVTVQESTLAVSALAIMNNSKITALVVVDADKHPVGMIHLHDLLRAGVV